MKGHGIGLKGKVWSAVILTLFLFCFILPFAGCSAQRSDPAFRIYLVRHGQTDANLNGILAGSGTDVSLNRTGISQSQRLGQAFSKYGIAFDQAYSSEMTRAQETASVVLEAAGQQDLEVETLSDLNDLSWGELEGVSIVEAQTVYGTQIDDYLNYDPQSSEKVKNPFGAENISDFVKRFQSGMNTIVRKGKKDSSVKNILVVSHSAAGYWLMENFDDFSGNLQNDSVTVLEYKDGKLSLTAYNITDYSQLEDITKNHE